MKLYFYNKNKQENIDNVDYPIGTMLITFVNEFSYNKKLYEQKDSNLMNLIYITYEQLFLKNLLEIFNTSNSNQASNEYLTLEVKLNEEHTKSFRLSNTEFEELVMLLEHIKNFLSLKYKKEDASKYFMYYFNTYFGYEIPRYIVKNSKATYDSNKKLLEAHKDMKDINQLLQKNLLDSLKELKKLQQSNKADFITEYDCDTIIDILLSSLHYISNNGIDIRKCDICDRLFIPTSNSQKCCPYIRPRLENESEEDYENVMETCSQYNSKYQSINRMSDIDKAKRTVTQRIQKRIRENNEDNKYLDTWKKKVLDARELYPDDNKYIDWILNNSDAHQKRRKRNGSSRTNKK